MSMPISFTFQFCTRYCMIIMRDLRGPTGEDLDLRLKSKSSSRLQALIADGIPNLRNQPSYPLGCLRAKVRQVQGARYGR